MLIVLKRTLAQGVLAALLLLGINELRDVQKIGKTFDFASEPKSYRTAVQRAGPAVVNVYGNLLASRLSKGLRLGSGVIVTPNGYIITNHHLVEQVSTITVALQDGRLFREVQLVGSDKLTDIAVLKINGSQLPVIPGNLQRPIQIGDIVLAIGNPFNLGQTVTQGIISATERIRVTPGNIGRQRFLQTDAAINQGNSGGALVNTLGELIGINTLLLNEQGIESSGNIGFAIPAKIALEVMQQIIREGRVVRGYLGFELMELSVKQRNELGLWPLNGLFVKSVERQDTLGLIQPGDIILQVNGISIITALETMTQVANIPPGEQVELQVLRQGHKHQISISVTELPIH